MLPVLDGAPDVEGNELPNIGAAWNPGVRPASVGRGANGLDVQAQQLSGVRKCSVTFNGSVWYRPDVSNGLLALFFDRMWQRSKPRC